MMQLSHASTLLRFYAYILTAILLLGSTFLLNSQTCTGLDFLQRVVGLNTTGCPLEFKTASFPTIDIAVNIHFIRGNNPPESFYPGLPGDTSPWNGNAMIDRVFDFWLNQKWLPNLEEHPNPAQPSVPGDSRMRMHLLADLQNPNDTWGGIWYWDSVADIVDYYGGDVLNIIIFSDDPGDLNLATTDQADDPATSNCDPFFRGASALACNLGTFCNTIEVWDLGNKIRYTCPSQVGNIDFFYVYLGRNILHEFGHVTGLCHSFAPNNPCTDIDPSIECNNTAPDGGVDSCGGDAEAGCTDGGLHTNNIMGYGEKKTSLSPCQWVTMYSYLYENSIGYANIGQDGDCDLIFTDDTPSSTYTITTGNHEVFDEVTFMFDDIVIEANASLRVHCTLLMAPDKSIEVKRGGKLIVDQAEIINLVAGESWYGITVEGNGAKPQPNPSLSNPTYSDPTVAGSVILNFASIIGAKTAISTRHRTEWWKEEYWGGLIAATRSYFTNNDRAVEFMKYELYADDFPAQSLVPNKSVFNECVFNEVDNSVPNSYGVTIWKCNAISFLSCRFENLDQTGIYGIDCGFNMRNNTLTNVNQTAFVDNLRAIELFSTYSNSAYSISIEQARFERTAAGPNANNVEHILVESGSELSNFVVKNCEFVNGRLGLQIEGPTGFGVISNVFTNLTSPLRFRNTGETDNEVRCNLITKKGLSPILFRGDNRRTLMRYNDIFDINSVIYEVLIREELGHLGQIKENQGASNDPREKLFYYR